MPRNALPALASVFPPDGIAGTTFLEHGTCNAAHPLMGTSLATGGGAKEKLMDDIMAQYGGYPAPGLRSRTMSAASVTCTGGKAGNTSFCSAGNTHCLLGDGPQDHKNTLGKTIILF